MFHFYINNESYFYSDQWKNGYTVSINVNNESYSDQCKRRMHCFNKCNYHNAVLSLTIEYSQERKECEATLLDAYPTIYYINCTHTSDYILYIMYFANFRWKYRYPFRLSWKRSNNRYVSAKSFKLANV